MIHRLAPLALVASLAIGEDDGGAVVFSGVGEGYRTLVGAHYDHVSGKRFLVFRSQNGLCVVEANPPTNLVSKPQVEPDGPVSERSRTYGVIPPGWRQYGFDHISGMKLVERAKP